jgi:cytochrome c551/c552
MNIPVMRVMMMLCLLGAAGSPPLVEANPGEDFDRSLQLAEQKGCLECHTLGRSYIGPSFAAIAKRYRGNHEYRDKLPYIIRGGSVGHWGDRFVMWPRPRLSDSEVRQLVDWILSQ